MDQPALITVAQQTAAEQTIKKSRFVATIAPITSEVAANQVIDKVKASLPKATHHVYAYVLGNHNEITRQSDDGEPSGTAASPVLNVITNDNLHNVIIIVTRFFGGIKLGAGGLIRAYGSSASLVVNQAPRLQRQSLIAYQISLSYDQAEPLMNWISERVVNIDHIDYGAAVTLTLLLESSDETFETDLMNQTNGRAKILETTPTIAWIPYQ